MNYGLASEKPTHDKCIVVVSVTTGAIVVGGHTGLILAPKIGLTGNGLCVDFRAF